MITVLILCLPDPVSCFFGQHKFIVVDCLLHIVIFNCESMFPQILSVDFCGLVHSSKEVLCFLLPGAWDNLKL